MFCERHSRNYNAFCPECAAIPPTPPESAEVAGSVTRTKPEDADWYDWTAFCAWADENGVGDIPEDYEAWWDCWKRAYSAAMQ